MVEGVVSNVWDIIASVLLLFIVYYIASHHQQNKEIQYNHYSYFTKVLFLKIAAGLFFSFIYIFFFKGGDTVYYFKGSRSIVYLGYKDVTAVFKLIVGFRTPELRSLFDYRTWQPTYFNDPNSWAVCRFMTVFYILGLTSYWGATIVMNAILFIPLWNFYKMLIHLYPKLKKHMIIALFLMPSFMFWCSGILKDIWCFTAIIQLYVSTWKIFYRHHRIRSNIFIIIFWTYILISIRPFMFYTTFITIAVWIGMRWLQSIENSLIKNLTLPIVLIFLGLGSVGIISQLGSVAEGKYATMDSMMHHAVVIQQDLSRTEAYGENTFDIGEFDASIPSMLSKAPVAIVAGIFRPFIWEARSFLMLLSGLESVFLLSLFGYLFFRSGFFEFFRIIFKDPFLVSCFAFVILFSFFVGLTTANFGALVRYKAPIIPFFAIILFRVRAVVEGKG